MSLLSPNQQHQSIKGIQDHLVTAMLPCNQNFCVIYKHKLNYYSADTLRVPITVTMMMMMTTITTTTTATTITTTFIFFVYLDWFSRCGTGVKEVM